MCQLPTRGRTSSCLPGASDPLGSSASPAGAGPLTAELNTLLKPRKHIENKQLFILFCLFVFLFYNSQFLPSMTIYSSVDSLKESRTQIGRFVVQLKEGWSVWCWAGWGFSQFPGEENGRSRGPSCHVAWALNVLEVWKVLSTTFINFFST